MEFAILIVIVSRKPFTLLQFIFRAIEMWQIATFDIFKKLLCRTFQICTKWQSNCQSDVSIKRFYVFFQNKNIFFEFSRILLKKKKQEEIFQTTVTKYLETFLLFSIMSLHHNWNRARLLSETECTGYSTSCWMTKDLR